MRGNANLEIKKVNYVNAKEHYGARDAVLYNVKFNKGCKAVIRYIRRGQGGCDQSKQFHKVSFYKGLRYLGTIDVEHGYSGYKEGFEKNINRKNLPIIEKMVTVIKKTRDGEKKLDSYIYKGFDYSESDLSKPNTEESLQRLKRNLLRTVKRENRKKEKHKMKLSFSLPKIPGSLKNSTWYLPSTYVENLKDGRRITPYFYSEKSYYGNKADVRFLIKKKDGSITSAYSTVGNENKSDRKAKREAIQKTRNNEYYM